VLPSLIVLFIVGSRHIKNTENPAVPLLWTAEVVLFGVLLSMIENQPLAVTSNMVWLSVAGVLFTVMYVAGAGLQYVSKNFPVHLFVILTALVAGYRFQNKLPPGDSVRTQMEQMESQVMEKIPQIDVEKLPGQIPYINETPERQQQAKSFLDYVLSGFKMLLIGFVGWNLIGGTSYAAEIGSSSFPSVAASSMPWWTWLLGPAFVMSFLYRSHNNPFDEDPLSNISSAAAELLDLDLNDRINVEKLMDHLAYFYPENLENPTPREITQPLSWTKRLYEEFDEHRAEFIPELEKIIRRQFLGEPWEIFQKLVAAKLILHDAEQTGDLSERDHLLPSLLIWLRKERRRN
jgi:hypothetical protein